MTNSNKKRQNLEEELVLLAEMRRRQCERSYYEFLKDAFVALYPNEPFEDNWHIAYVCGVLQAEMERLLSGRPKVRDLIINIPPRSLKSFMCSIALPAWVWTRNPHRKFISSSYSGDLSLEHNVLTRDLVNTDWYRANWGGQVIINNEFNTKTYFKLEGGGSRKCTSTGGSITGSGADVVIVDDPVNPMMAMSDIEREQANKHFDNTLSSRLDNPKTGLFLIVMQRLHENDLTGHLLSKGADKYQHVCIPAEMTPAVKPSMLAQNYVEGNFFPSRFTEGFLSNQLMSLGSLNYAGQYLQSPSTEGGSLIRVDWFGRFRLEELEKQSPVWDFAIDAAYTKKEKNDPTAIIAYAKTRTGLYIRNVERVRMELPELVRHIKGYVMRNGYSRLSRIFIEPKASGMSAAQLLRSYTALNIVIDEAPTTDKVSRVNSVAPYIEGGNVFLLEGAPWIEQFAHECEMFPNAKHDDMVDVLTIACNKAAKMLHRRRAKITIR